ncbi:YezD family protein [Methylomicrobium sp. RS1]|uniref:YezD family protein n=1 Tax=Candidatus Methylomicrobium oryzae TaxID=2802053 RepID=UPI0019243226|nr:YezD family protein [Methylomicrobium sp. RS1]MBL1264752.1 YezD family protein [Methylomicrobium sp. RS1]
MANHVEPSPTKNQHLEIMHQISQMLEGIRFGSLEIIVHEGKVVQIERKEKLRPDLSRK